MIPISPTQESAFAVRKLRKSYGSRVVFESLDLSIPRGRTVFVLGLNGSGKSTLLHCLAGLEPFEEGEITISPSQDDVEQTILPGMTLGSEIRRKLGIVFQNAGNSLWPHKTALANVADPLSHRALADDPANRARQWLLDLQFEEENLARYPEQLSGGQQQRVAIARTLACNPEILLLDEVTDHLDPRGVERLLRILKERYVEASGKTLVVVTHWPDLLARWDAQVIVIHKGKATVHPSSHFFLDQHSTEVISDVTPQSHELLCGRRCLEAATNVMAAALESREDNQFPQRLVEVVSDLLSAIDPASHLVLLVLRDPTHGNRLVIRGAHKSADFELDGKDAEVGLRDILQIQQDQSTRKPVVVLNEEFLRNDPMGKPFPSQGSMIAAMFDTDRRTALFEERSPDDPPGIVIARVADVRKDRGREIQYYEFSTKTNVVYLFAMQWKDQVVGVLSIDTTADGRWLPFVVRNLNMIAGLGAIATREHADAGHRGTVVEPL